MSGALLIYHNRADIVEEVRALRSLEYLANETHYLPWYAALSTRLSYIKRMLYSTSTFGELQVHLIHLCLLNLKILQINNTFPMYYFVSLH